MDYNELLYSAIEFAELLRDERVRALADAVGCDATDEVVRELCMHDSQHQRASEFLASAQVQEPRSILLRLRSALSNLYDLQNGCPLPKYQERWEQAMAEAADLLGYRNQETL